LINLVLHVQKEMQNYLSSLAEAIKYVSSPIIFTAVKQRSLRRGRARSSMYW